MFDTVRHRGELGCYSRGDDMTESTAVSPTVEAARVPGRMEQPAPSANRAPPRPRKRRLSLRFSLVSLLPTGMLLLFILGLVASGPPTTPPDLNRALGWIDGLSGGRILALCVLTLTLSLLLHPFQFGLVRFLEGYWDGWAVGRLLGRAMVARHRRRLAQLQAIAWSIPHTKMEAGRQRRALGQLEPYPAADRLLPTRLGNALRASEDEAGPRYGFATMTMFPRLYPTLSDRLAGVVDDARDQLDTATRMSVTLLVATAVSATLLGAHGPWLAVPATTALLSWIAYRAAVRTARTYGQALCLAFDLHRFDMLQALHYPLPTNPTQERAFNERLSEFFISGCDPDDAPTNVYAHLHEARAAE
jgi:hypothetical protein